MKYFFRHKGAGIEKSYKQKGGWLWRGLFPLEDGKGLSDHGPSAD